ncbi:hypothetical protein ZHAS_00020508 [Anopheles sinensis]|uniref:Uncharacterized protein n=1 Tax=Anopheles sinensis TaxID=74873 RepID=A0A084WQ16_ANOSI|nr:hypothetical protein ZHAS_00020508 [Anopheles sinensis]
MGECVKTCCFCCASCFQPSLCCGSLCCLLIPLLGLLIILFGAVLALIGALAWMLQHQTEPVVSRMLAALTNSSISDTLPEDGQLIVQ